MVRQGKGPIFSSYLLWSSIGEGILCGNHQIHPVGVRAPMRNSGKAGGGGVQEVSLTKTGHRRFAGVQNWLSRL